MTEKVHDLIILGFSWLWLLFKWQRLITAHVCFQRRSQRTISTIWGCGPKKTSQRKRASKICREWIRWPTFTDLKHWLLMHTVSFVWEKHLGFVLHRSWMWPKAKCFYPLQLSLNKSDTYLIKDNISVWSSSFNFNVKSQIWCHFFLIACHNCMLYLPSAWTLKLFMKQINADVHLI